jgi:hypothetical protein
LFLVKTNYNKVFGIFAPSNYKAYSLARTSNRILAFYWINDNSDLVTCSRAYSPIYGDNWDGDLINIYATLQIAMDRSKEDVVFLHADDGWGVKVDSSNYPIRKDWYYSINGHDLISYKS